MNDYLGNPIEAGDRIIYPVFARGKLRLREATVVEVRANSIVGMIEGDWGQRRVNIYQTLNLIRRASVCPDTT